MLQTTNNKNWYINNLKKSTNNKNCNKQFKKSIDTIKIGKSTNNLTNIKTIMYLIEGTTVQL